MRRANPNVVTKATAVGMSANGSTGFKKWHNNGWTWVEPNGDVVYSLHRTKIVVAHADGSFSLNSGGWNTMTTIKSMNQALRRSPHGYRFSVHSENGGLIMLDRDRPGFKSRRFERDITYRPDDMEPSRVNPSRRKNTGDGEERVLYVHQADTMSDVRIYVWEFDPSATILYAERLKPGKWRVVLSPKKRSNPGPYDPRQSKWFHSARGSKARPKRGPLIQLEQGDYGYYLIRKVYRGSRGIVETKQTRPIRTDWDYPGVASTFGWQMPKGANGCRHSGSDGTVNCQTCGMKASRFIHSAQRFLDKIAHDNVVVEDPGYFD